MIFLYIGIFVILSLVIFLTVIYIIFLKAFNVSKKQRKKILEIPNQEQYKTDKAKMAALIDEINALPFERVYITSFDGLRLAARYYHIDDEAPLEIQFHGYRSSAVRDFCGGNKLARENGLNTLVVDQRAHGLSEGHVITLGIKERFDCLYWIKYACTRFKDKHIYLSGISMGAATVLMASDFDLPDNVKGIIADCPYSSPEDMLKKVAADKNLPKKMSFALLKIGARIFGKFDLEESSALEAVKKAKIPILLIHGEADHFVPCEMSKQIAKNCNAELAIFPNAGHGQSFIVDPERYGHLVSNFIAFCEK